MIVFILSFIFIASCFFYRKKQYQKQRSSAILNAYVRETAVCLLCAGRHIYKEEWLIIDYAHASLYDKFTGAVIEHALGDNSYAYVSKAYQDLKPKLEEAYSLCKKQN